MENKIKQIFVLDLGWICVDNRDYSKIEIHPRKDSAAFLKIFDNNNKLTREVDGQYVIAIDYEK